MDILGHTIGEVLSQEQDGKWKPIAFSLRTMQPAERNYEIYDKELLAIVKVLTKWRQYLLDAMEPFEVWMDYENLKYFQEPHKLMDNKLDSTWSYKTMISLCDIFQARWIQRQTFFQEKIRLTWKRITKTSKCSRKNYGEEES